MLIIRQNCPSYGKTLVFDCGSGSKYTSATAQVCESDTLAVESTIVQTSTAVYNDLRERV
jgi:hypothetical protein